MPFFARPNLSDEQFKQIAGSQLTLSGQTRISTVTGLTLTNGVGGYVPIVATGGTVGYVMTYDANNKITLKPSTGGGGVYAGASPTTCSVGGLPSGSAILGCSISCILEEILVPTVNPTLTAPSEIFFNLVPSISTYEIGTSISVTGYTAFSRGCINPAYGTSGYRSGVPKSYNYNRWGTELTPVISSASSNNYSFGSHVVTLGNNTLSSCIVYTCGEQPKNSCGGNYSTPLPSGNTASISRVICGTLPWFWGSSVSAPVVNQSLLSNYTCKCVANSTNTITVDNFNVTGRYIWLAIPATSTSKTCWQGANNPSNNGTIAGGLFPAATLCSVQSPEYCWGVGVPISYKFYVSNYATNVNYGMTFCN